MVATPPSEPGALALTYRVAAAGLVAASILATTSYLINVLWLGASHDALDVFRPDDDLRRMPGLIVSSLVWGVLLAGGFRVFWQRPADRSGWREGAKYGLCVWLFFTVIQSVFLYQFIRITSDLLLGDILHYFVATTLAGAAIGAIVPRGTPR